jgi:hypothetical protein
MLASRYTVVPWHEEETTSRARREEAQALRVHYGANTGKKEPVWEALFLVPRAE